MNTMTRRSFVKAAATASAACAVLPGGRTAAPNEKVVVGVMGLGGRGTYLATAFARRPDAEIAWLCDPDSRRFEGARRAVATAQSRVPRVAQDFRRILEDPAVDVLINATPDHWHGLGSILACQAGKDVYVEKPMTHNVWEGRKLIEAAQKYRRIVQVGTQTRSAPYAQQAAEYYRSGKLGEVYLVRVFNLMEHGPMKLGPEQPPPDGFDYDLWCGPAAKLPYRSGRYWLNLAEYSCGPIPGDAVHQLDLARFFLGDPPYPDTVAHSGGLHVLRDGRDTPDTQFALFEYGKLTLQFEGALWTPYLKKTPMPERDIEKLPNWPFNSTRIEVLGTRGMLYLGRHGDGWQVFNEAGESIIASSPPQSDQEHQDNFMACVRSRKTPNAPAEQGHYSTLLCHLANISWRTGNRKLALDPKTETFVGVPEANAHLRRTYRAPWVVPDAV
ncbi:MAG: Gfo/Idh/MocA family oxidoreductase [Verrucomicrobia bacterium]|nr:Gfo/Idh/MocA family oxidoreductase [Verrucomicrobiota bacterium]